MAVVEVSLVELDFGDSAEVDALGLEVPNSLVDVAVTAIPNIWVSNIEESRRWRVFGVRTLCGFFLPMLLG